ncbi:MAG: class A beta-lactamase-related serine hydrolase [Bacteroidetes bacterium]|nr:class A beta-lactamase-related serine hydrolase [Bacteroidota bacterium]
MNALTPGIKNKNLFNKDTPLYITILLVIVSGAIVYFIFPHPLDGKKITTIVSQTPDCFPELNNLRSGDFQLAHRLLLSDIKSENPKLISFKERLNQFIAKDKTSNGVSDVSIYYRNLNDGSWFAINGGDVYNPASLMKVTYLIAILKQAEYNPRILEQKILFQQHFAQGNNQNIQDFHLQENKYYTLKELLQYMIIYSDNDAAFLVSQNTNQEIYRKLFVDLGITVPTEKGEYFISVVDYCKMFRVLYNSSYLRDDYSEFALELLTKSTYKDGLLKSLNTNFPIAHKFGERIINHVQQLHEVGIFYADSHPYILGVMSTGSDLRQLSSMLSQVSQIVYEESARPN